MRNFSLILSILLIFCSREYVLNDPLHTNQKKQEQNSFRNSKVKRLDRFLGGKQVLLTSTPKSSLSRVECTYLAEKEQISCNNGLVQCNANEKLEGLNIKFDMLGAGIDPINNRMINLYAKNFSDKSFSLEVPLNNGGSTRLSIFQQNSGLSKGVMIKDQQCFNNLIALFQSIQTPLLAEAKARTDTNTNTHTESKVAISGFILAV